MTLSHFVTFSISALRNLDIEANKLYDRELIDYMVQHFLQGAILSLLFSLILTLKLIM